MHWFLMIRNGENKGWVYYCVVAAALVVALLFKNFLVEFWGLMLGVEPRTSHTLSTHLTTELLHSSEVAFYL